MAKEQESGFLEGNKKPLAVIALAAALTVAWFFLFFRPEGLEIVGEKFFPQNPAPEPNPAQQMPASEIGQPPAGETAAKPQGAQNSYPQRGTASQQALGQNGQQDIAERESSQATGEGSTGEELEQENQEISPLGCLDLEGRVCPQGTSCSEPVRETIDTQECCFGECA